MDELSLEQLLQNANQAVMHGNWTAALDYLQQAREIQPYNADLFTAIAGVLIQMGKMEEAIPYFQEALRLQPYSAQAYQNLSNAYALLERYDEAEESYRRALELDDDDRFSWMGLARVCILQGKYEEGIQIMAALVQSDPQDALAMTLLAECYELAGDLISARWLYEQAIQIDANFEIAKMGLERIQLQEPSPAEIDKQALAQKLSALKSKLQAHKSQLTPSKTTAVDRLLFCAPPLASSEVRLGPLAQELIRRGVQVKITTHFDELSKEGLRYALFSRPHYSDELTQAVLQSKAKGAKVIVDLDEDFFSLPTGYYHYDSLSAQQPEVASRLKQVLQAADVITVPSDDLLEVYRKEAKQVHLLPYGWDDTNPMWKKPVPPEPVLKIGILANHTQPADLPVLGDSLQHICQENPQVLIGIVAGLEVYEQLSGIDEERKFFVPPGKIEDYPFLLADFTLLIFPLQNIPYNHSKSDLALLECGARKVSWVASPIPAYQAWEKGGKFASTPEEWKQAIQALLASPAQRYQFAEEGHQKALQRTAAIVADRWLELLNSL